MSSAAPDELSSALSRLSGLTRDAWSSATSAADRLAAELGLASTSATSALERRVRPKIERGAAAFRWSFGPSTTVPLPVSWDEPRTLLAMANLARVLYDELDAHRLHTNGSNPNSADPAHDHAAPPQLPLPPVTCALVAASVWRFLHPVPVRQVSLNPYCVVERRETGRLLGSCLAHLDATHLATNVAALLPVAAALERREGSALFAADLALVAAASSGLFVGWGVFEKEVLQRNTTYYAVGAIGLSSLAFALEVVHGESRRGSSVSVLGLPLPAQFAWVAQLGLTHVMAPDASFAGHMAGVLAGIAHTYVLRPALRALVGRREAPPRFHGSGTLSGRPVSGRGGGGGRNLRRTLVNALSQLGLAAAAIAVYALVSQRRTRPPLSNWSLR